MAGNHGGARPGAGRKPNSEKYSTQIESLTDECAAHARPAFHRLWELIDPKPRIERKYQPANMIFRKGLALDKDGNPVTDDKGKPSIVDVRVFPDLDDDELVLVESKEIERAPDVLAIRELFDRLMGKPGQALELSNGDDGPLKIEVVYADAKPEADDPEPTLGAAAGAEGDEAV